MAKFIFYILLNFLIVSSFVLTKDYPKAPDFKSDFKTDFENSIDPTDQNQIATTLVPLSLLNSSPVNFINDFPNSAGLSLNSPEQSSPRPAEEANSISLNDSISLLIVNREILTTTVPSPPAQTTFNSTNFDLTQSTTSSTSTPYFDQSSRTAIPSHSESSTPSTSTISPVNNSTSQRKKLNCGKNSQARIKIDCRRYFRCVKSKTKFVIRVNACKQNEYFDDQLGSCRIATTGENSCDSRTDSKIASKTSSRKAGTKRRRKNSYKTKNKRNRSLNGQSDVLRLSFDDFDLGHEDEIDLDRLNYRLSHRRNGYENSHVIVITDHEDEEAEESSYESLEGSVTRNEDEQDDSEIEEKRTEEVLPCKYREKLDDLKRVSGHEIVVKNLTEVHINNTIIHITDSKPTYSSPKEKINKRKENDQVQNHESSDDNSEDGDRTRRVPKNVTEIEQSHDHTNSTNLNDRKEHQNDSEQSDKKRRITTNTTITEERFGDENGKHDYEHQNSKTIIKNSTSVGDHPLGSEKDSSGEFHNGKRIIKNITTIITEEESSESKKSDQINSERKEIDKKTADKPGSNDQTDSGRIVTKNVTTIITTDEEAKKNQIPRIEPTTKAPKTSGDQSHSGKRVIKNVTIIIEEESSESKRSNQTNSSERKEIPTEIPKEIDKQKINQPGPSSDSQTNSGRTVIRNETITITTEEAAKKIEHPRIEATTKAPKSLSDQSHSGKRIIKNTTIIIEEESSESKKGDQTNPERKEIPTEIDKQTINKPSPPSESQTNSGRTVIRNETITITTEEDAKKELHPKIEQTTRAPEPFNDQLQSGKRIIKNVTTIITEETNESSSSKVTQSGVDQGDSKRTQTVEEKPLTSNDGSKRVIKNVTTIITEEEENAKGKAIDQPPLNQSEKIITKNVTITDKNFNEFDKDKLPFEHQTNKNSSESSPIVSRNESFGPPCESRLNHMKPIAKIIETHHVIKTLFGSLTNDLKSTGFVNFVRHVRKNVTKVIRPNSLDDATSLILDRNVSDYLVNEVHEMEEKVIFEEQASSGRQPGLIDSHSTGQPLESTSHTEDLEKSTTAQINPFKPSSTTRNPYKSSTIDPHGFLDDALTTPSTTPPTTPNLQDSKNYSTPSSNSMSSEKPFDFSVPQGPVYFDETGNCRFEGFHLDVTDASCRRFYLCKVHSETGRFTVEPFVCVSGQVFDPERKVCVYKEMSKSCSHQKPSESSNSTSGSLDSKSEERKNANDESSISKNAENTDSTRPSTGLPILFTESSQANTQSTTEKPASNQDGSTHSIRLNESSSEKPLQSSSRGQLLWHLPDRYSHYSSSEGLSDQLRVRTSSRSKQHKNQFAYPNDLFSLFSMYSGAHFNQIGNPLYVGNSYNQHRSYPFTGPFPYNGFR